MSTLQDSPQRETQGRQAEAADSRRLTVLLGGSALGIVLVALGLVFAWQWRSTVTGGWEAWHGKDAWHLWVIVLCVVGGLAAMFVSLQLGRADEHSDTRYRRWLYGANAALGGVLLLLILVVVNLLVYVPWGPLRWFNTTYDWSTRSIYSLSSKSHSVLEGLDKPLHVYAILSPKDPFSPAVHALLENCEAVNPEIKVKYLSPDQDQDEIKELNKEYKYGEERDGLLVVYGSARAAENRFIKRSDLFSTPMDFSQNDRQPVFNGEVALMTQVNTLAEGKEKPVIYFTQGNGELDLSNSTQSEKLDEGAGVLKKKLEAGNLAVKGLQLSAVAGLKSKNPDVVISKEVPSDAAVVCIVGPQRPFDQHALDALREYVEPKDAKKAKGKLIVALNPVLDREQRMQKLGIEDLLAGYGVVVGNDRVLALEGTRSPEIVLVRTNRDRAARERNALLAAFPRRDLLLIKARTIRPSTDNKNPEQNRYQTDVLLETVPETSAWAETNLQASVQRLINDYNRKGEWERIVSQTPLSVAVSVSDMTPSSPGDPHAALRSDQKPRMVVFGNATPLCNLLVDNPNFDDFYSLFSSSIAWLREKPASIGIEAKKPDIYALEPDAKVSTIVGVPTLLMLVGIIGVGAGVWVVRRR
jgi:ABC-type uncharacterized transport system